PAARPPAEGARLRDPDGWRRRPGPGPGAPGRPRRSARGAPGARRPGAAVRRAAAVARPGRPSAARVPDRLDRPRPAPARRPVPRRRPQDQLAGPVRRAAHRRGLPTRRPGRRDDLGHVPAAGAALRRRPAPVPAVAAPRLRPAPAPRWGPLPVPAGHDRSGRAPPRRRALRRLLVAPAGVARGRPVRAARRNGEPMTTHATIADFVEAEVLTP